MRYQEINQSTPAPVTEDSQRFVLYLNGRPVATFTSQMDAERQADTVKQRIPDTNIEIKQEVCTLTPVELKENLRNWFKEKWVRFGPDGKIRGDCARGSNKEGKPKCLPQSKAHALGKKGRASSAAKKRREDPNPERRGAAKNVATKVKEDDLDENCWKGYHKEGNKKMFGKTVPNCVKNTNEGEVVPFPKDIATAKELAKKILTVMTDGDMDLQKRNNIINYHRLKLKELGYEFAISQGQATIRYIETGKIVPVALDEAFYVKDKTMEKVIAYLVEKNRLVSWIPINTMKFTLFQEMLRKYPSTPDAETFYLDLVKFCWPRDTSTAMYGRGAATNKKRVITLHQELVRLDAFGEPTQQPDDDVEYYGQGLGENFADGKKPGRKGLAKRSGVNCKASVTQLRKVAKNSTGEKQRMAHWCANMKLGKKK